MFYCNNHCHCSDLIANQACYAFQHVLSPEQNELTNHLPFVTGHNNIFMLQTPIPVDLKDG